MKGCILASVVKVLSGGPSLPNCQAMFPPSCGATSSDERAQRKGAWRLFGDEAQRQAPLRGGGTGTHSCSRTECIGAYTLLFRNFQDLYGMLPGVSPVTGSDRSIAGGDIQDAKALCISEQLQRGLPLRLFGTSADRRVVCSRSWKLRAVCSLKQAEPKLPQCPSSAS